MSQMLKKTRKHGKIFMPREKESLLIMHFLFCIIDALKPELVSPGKRAPHRAHLQVYLSYAYQPTQSLCPNHPFIWHLHLGHCPSDPKCQTSKNGPYPQNSLQYLTCFFWQKPQKKVLAPFFALPLPPVPDTPICAHHVISPPPLLGSVSNKLNLQ